MALLLVLVACGCHSSDQHEKLQRAKWTTRVLLDQVFRKTAAGIPCAEAVQLVAKETQKSADPWGSLYRFACEPRIAVGSAGPDKAVGTEDDISAVEDVPEAAP